LASLLWLPRFRVDARWSNQKEGKGEGGEKKKENESDVNSD
jgi:hypothetical protein